MPEPLVWLSFVIGVLSGALSILSLVLVWRAKSRSGKIDRFHQEVKPVLQEIEKSGPSIASREIVKFIVAFASNLIFGTSKPPPHKEPFNRLQANQSYPCRLCGDESVQATPDATCPFCNLSCPLWIASSKRKEASESVGS